MKKLLLRSITIVVIILVSVYGLVAAEDWNSNPNNWNNNPNNWDNNPNNWKNSPNNWDNSPNKWGNDRIIRDNSGNPTGYAVPKDDGGINIYDFNGNRRGYKPADEDE